MPSSTLDNLFALTLFVALYLGSDFTWMAINIFFVELMSIWFVIFSCYSSLFGLAIGLLGLILQLSFGLLFKLIF